MGIAHKRMFLAAFAVSLAFVLSAGVVLAYSATFYQNNIPAGTPWGVAVNGTRYTSTGSSTTVPDLSGTASYTYDATVPGGEGTRYSCNTGCSGSVSQALSTYRKPVTVSNSGPTLTDYQVQVTLDTASLISAGKMSIDCGDIRLADSDGSTQLSYWLESGCNSASTKIWVRVPSVPAGSKTIYVYYGSPGATYNNTLGGNSTFVFFDDFSGASLDTSKWAKYTDGNSDIILDAGRARLRVYKCSNARITSSFPASSNNSVGFDWWEQTDNWCEEPRTVQVLVGGIAQAMPSFGGCRYYSGNGHIDAVINVANPSTENVIPRIDQSWACGNSDHGNTYMWVDNVRVRKYSSPEPTTSAGAEESSTSKTASYSTQYRLTLSSNPSAGGTTSPASGNWFNPGQIVQITATPATNYTFVSWTGTGAISDSGFSNVTTVTMNSPITETANFVSTTKSLQVYPGWNLVSFPHADLTVFNNNCNPSDLVFYTWSSANKWQAVGPANVQAGKGYWMYNTQPSCQISYAGTVNISSSSISPAAGWNTIGGNGWLLSSVKGSCNVLNEVYWDAGTQSFVTATKLDTGRGYWIQVSSGCKFV